MPSKKLGLKKSVKKKRQEPPTDSGGRCAAYCTGESYNLDQLRAFLQDNRFILSIHQDVIHISYTHDITNGFALRGEREASLPPASCPGDGQPRFPWLPPWLARSGHSHVEADEAPPEQWAYSEPRQAKDIFFFEDGAFVCWGTTLAEETLWQAQLEGFKEDFLLSSQVSMFQEVVRVYQSASPGVHNDCVVLGDTSDDALNQQQLSFSYSLVRSLKLDVLETLMENALERMRDLPTNLKMGRLPTYRKSRELVGEQLELRGMINLYSQLLETPELYWEEPFLQKLFEEMELNLEIADRIQTLNQRLSHAQEITTIAHTYLHDREGRWMEIAIIALITLEVVFALLDKSLWWRSWTWEGVLGIDPPPSDEVQTRRH